MSDLFCLYAVSSHEWLFVPSHAWLLSALLRLESVLRRVSLVSCVSNDLDRYNTTEPLNLNGKSANLCADPPIDRTPRTTNSVCPLTQMLRDTAPRPPSDRESVASASLESRAFTFKPCFVNSPAATSTSSSLALDTRYVSEWMSNLKGLGFWMLITITKLLPCIVMPFRVTVGSLKAARQHLDSTSPITPLIRQSYPAGCARPYFVMIRKNFQSNLQTHRLSDTQQFVSAIQYKHPIV